jgi:hypothetical protein
MTTADDFRAHLRERDLFTELERPILEHVFVRGVGEACAAFFHPLVEDLEQFGGRSRA